jgi:hypothetical protein
MANEIDWGQGAKNNAIGWGQGAANNSIGWGLSHFDSPSGETEIYGIRQDAAVSAFLTATGITDTTITSALEDLVADLKSYSIWDKMKAIYPFVGATATTHKFNLKDARDLDAAFRLAFSGGWTHNSNGVTPNGVNAFANTFFNPRTSLTIGSNSQGQYQRLNAIDSGFRGVWDNTTAFRLEIVVNGFSFSGNCNTQANGVFLTSSAIADTRGLILSKSQGGQFKFLRNSNIFASTTAGSTIYPNRPYYLAALNNNGTTTSFSNMPLSFSFLGDGLTDEDSANLYYSVQKFQTTLGRQVGTPIYSSNATDVNARLFLGATNIQDVTITSAVDTLVQGLKTDGVWSKLKAVYPFVGGTATTHKFNLANALDEDSAFRLSFFGGWTHSTNGATPNGTNGYADTFLNPATNLATNNASLGYYGGNVVTASPAAAMGSLLSVPFRVFSIAPALSGFGLFGDVNDGSSTFTANNRQDGFIFASRDNSLNKIHSIRGTQTLKTEVSTSAPSVVSVIGARRFNTAIDSYCNFNFRLAFMGNGLTSTEATNLHTRVQAFQTSLSRNV